MSDLGVWPNYDLGSKWVGNKREKWNINDNSSSELTNHLEMVKKHVRLWSFSFLMPELRVRPKFWFLGRDEHETDAKKSDFIVFDLWAHKTLKNGKKSCQAFESLNSDVWARSEAQITILGLDEQEKDAKNGPSKNSASELANHLEMVKKT